MWKELYNVFNLLTLLLPGMKIKLLFTSFAAFLLVYCSYSQIPQAGQYYTNSDIDKFVGTWKWVSGSDVVFIKLKKVKVYNDKPGYHHDMLRGSHSYVQNGVTIENTLADFDLVSDSRRGTVSLYHDPGLGTNKVTGAYMDQTKSKNVKMQLEYLAGSPPQITMQLSVFGRIIYNKPVGITLPRNITLTKH